MNFPEQDIDDFYEHLQSIISKVPHKDKPVLMGDLNAHVEADNDT